MNCGDQRSAQCEQRAPISVGQESEVTDLDEAGGKHVQEKPPDELDGIDRQGLLRVSVPRVSPPEGDCPSSKRSRRPLEMAMRCVYRAKIFQHLLGSAERTLGVYHPALLFERVIEAIECRRSAQFREFARQANLLLAVGLLRTTSGTDSEISLPARARAGSSACGNGPIGSGRETCRRRGRGSAGAGDATSSDPTYAARPRQPTRAPSRLGSAAMVSKASRAARNRRS